MTPRCTSTCSASSECAAALVGDDEDAVWSMGISRAAELDQEEG